MDSNKTIQVLLMEFDFKIHLKGFKYLIDSIKLYDEEKEITLQEVYTQIGKKYKTTNTAIDRNLRTVISQSKLKGNSCKEVIVYLQFIIDSKINRRCL